MPNTGYWIVIKDLQGWRMSFAKRYDGVSFTVDIGDGNELQLSHEAFLATRSNLLALVKGGIPAPVKGQMYWPMQAEQVIDFLEEYGYAVDDNMRVYPKLGEPFTRIKPGHIGPMCMVHIKSCQEKDKNPEATPIILVWHEFEDEGQTKSTLCQVFDQNKLVPLPCEDEIVASGVPKEEVGRLSGTFCYFGKRICLKWQDFYLIPKGSNVLEMHKLIGQTEEGPESLDELFKEGKFIDKDGVVRKSGRFTLQAKTLSIEDFLK